MNPSLYHQARHRTLREAFVNEDGAIDLASIMVGIIVIGLIGGVIAATIFAVIPWAQDNGAKQQLDSVKSAEDAYRGLAEDKGLSAYGDNYQLSDPDDDGDKSDSLLDIDDGYVHITTTPAPNPTYTATVLSGSGKKFTMTNGGQVTEVPATPADNNDGGYNGGGSNGDGGYGGGGYNGGGDNGSSDTIDTSSRPNDPINAPASSSYKAGYIDQGTGSNQDDFYSISAEDAHESTLDGNRMLVMGSASQSDSTSYDALYRYVDSDAAVWDAKPYPYTGAYSSAKQFQAVINKNIVHHYIRADSVTIFDNNGQIGDTYTPSTGSVIDLISYRYSDGTSDDMYNFKTVLPSNFSETDRALQAAGQTTLIAKVVVDGKTLTFQS
jgi:type II secretory pathway pseudopilin PulG